MTDIGTIVDGKYEILKQIGKGGMSVVYLAMDNRLNKQWAIKEIRKKGTYQNDQVIINSLLAEANLMKRLDHAALPRIVDIIDNGQTIYIIMDYIEGESLDKILKEDGAQPEKLVLDWAKQLCDVLDYLHSQKPPIIYRDMKPGNVMLKPEGNLKVIDFGIAREYKTEHTADTTILGTKGYAPPEQHGARQTDTRSDIYALGMTMHHLLTNVDPRQADYVYIPIRQWNPELSEGMEAIINKCTALDPDNRYQGCSELMYDLEHPELITQGFKRTQKRKLKLVVAASILSIVFLIVGCTCRVLARSIRDNDYELLTSIVEATAYEEKIEKYKQAINIYPYHPKAYMCMLDAFENNGRFGKDENSVFLALYNANKDGLDPSDTAVAELNYQIGMMYFNYYKEDEGTQNYSSRVQKAYPFFAANVENRASATEFKSKELSDCYYQICSFYKQYILNSIHVEEASKEDYEKLLKIMNHSLDSVRTEGAYNQLSLYNGTIMLLYDQRVNMATMDLSQKSVLDLFDNVYNSVTHLVVQKEQSKKLQNEIINHYREYREAINRAYTNSEERTKNGR